MEAYLAGLAGKGETRLPVLGLLLRSLPVLRLGLGLPGLLGLDRLRRGLGLGLVVDGGLVTVLGATTARLRKGQRCWSWTENAHLRGGLLLLGLVGLGSRLLAVHSSSVGRLGRLLLLLGLLGLGCLRSLGLLALLEEGGATLRVLLLGACKLEVNLTTANLCRCEFRRAGGGRRVRVRVGGRKLGKVEVRIGRCWNSDGGKVSRLEQATRTRLVKDLDGLDGVGLVLERDEGVTGGTVLVAGRKNHRNAVRVLAPSKLGEGLHLALDLDLDKVLADLLLSGLERLARELIHTFATRRALSIRTEKARLPM